MNADVTAEWNTILVTLNEELQSYEARSVEHRLFRVWQIFTSFSELMKGLERKIPPLMDGSGRRVGFFRSDLLDEIEMNLHVVNGLRKSDFVVGNRSLERAMANVRAGLARYAEFMGEVRQLRMNSIAHDVVSGFIDDVHPKIHSLMRL